MFKPEPWQVPPPGGIHRPASVETTVSIPDDSTTDDRATWMQVAQQIVGVNFSQVQRFVNNMRQQVSLNGQSFASRRTQVPGIDVRWSINNGYERIQLNVYPTQPPGGLNQDLYDLNQDGYVVFILYDPKFPNILNNKPGFPKSYDIYMNGYLLKAQFMITQVCQAFVAMFGQTALRCESLVDKQHLNPLELQSNGGLVHKVLPPRAQVEGHDDLPAYQLFDFTRQMNPIYDDLILNLVGGTDPVKVNVTDGIQFFDPTKSPLNTKKGNSVNHFGLAITPGQTQASEDSIGYLLFAEFFSRKKGLRGVKQSWNKIAKPNGTVLVNDKPLYWGNWHVASYTSLTPGQDGLSFDLFDDDGGVNDLLAPIQLTGKGDNDGSFQQSIPPSADDDLTNYYAEVAKIELDFSTAMFPAIQAAAIAAGAARDNYNAASLALKKAHNQLDLLDEDITSLQSLNPAIFGIELANDIALLPEFKNNVKIADDLVVADLTKLNAADDVLDHLAGESPTLPPVPQIKANDDTFKFRIVTVLASDWTFGDWQNG